jgi:phosphoenolpyruvate-protein kinase (PTS system EI component)
LNIPVISGYKLDVKSNGTKIAMDTESNEIIINPDESVLADFQERYERWQSRLLSEQCDSVGEAYTADGHKITILGNVGDIATAELALQNGAEGVGLLRTEFLYMNSRRCPKENTQIAKLRNILTLFSTNSIIVRTLDAGGDKNISWLPDKGKRGVRLYLEHKGFIITHLKAILRAGLGYDMQIMIPMVSSAEDVEFAKELLQQAHSELAIENIEHKWPVELGVMIETPSAVFMADELACIADFFSIGTNDLSNYIMATDSAQTSVLRAIKMVLDVAKRRDIDVSVCGEMAGDPMIARLLIGMGAKKLSMNACSIGRVKRAIRDTSLSEMHDMATNALKYKETIPKCTN